LHYIQRIVGIAQRNLRHAKGTALDLRQEFLELSGVLQNRFLKGWSGTIPDHPSLVQRIKASHARPLNVDGPSPIQV
jgi:hypothetical protein